MAPKTRQVHGNGPAQGGSSLSVGIAWNLGALVFLAVAGIVLNVLIGRYFGAAALGTFNIAFALFIFFSQIAVFGLHLSALHRVSVVADQPEVLGVVVYSGINACAIVAAGVTLVAFSLNPVIQALFPEVPDLGLAWNLAAPGLCAFALNKYLLAVLNGIQRMRAFAIYQSLRFILIIAVVALVYALDMPGAWLPLSLATAEWSLLCLLYPYVRRVVERPTTNVDRREEMARHLRFGVKVLPAGLVAELNTRVDVLMIGALMNDRSAGVYTVAALVFEAAIQAVMVIRNNINPRLGRDIAAGRMESILKFSRILALSLTPVLALCGVAIWLLFPAIAPWIFPAADFAQAHEPLGWLMLALPLCGAPLCYSLILSVAGRPLWQSAQMMVALIASIALCLLLIPSFGIAGAAIAMAVSTFLTGVLGVVMSRKLLRVRIFF
jgi:O-antigen/teichoic acid export membrane protein